MFFAVLLFKSLLSSVSNVVLLRDIALNILLAFSTVTSYLLKIASSSALEFSFSSKNIESLTVSSLFNLYFVRISSLLAMVIFSSKLVLPFLKSSVNKYRAR